MITTKCTCEDCKDFETYFQAGSRGTPKPKPQIPGQFKWKPMLAADKYWTYLVTCKICKWEKFSDYNNAIDWLWFHHADDCQRPSRKWSR